MPEIRSEVLRVGGVTTSKYDASNDAEVLESRRWSRSNKAVYPH